MKKITVLILVLCLAVPVNAWHLFPVREKVIEAKKDNLVAYGIVGGTGSGIGVIIGFFWGVILTSIIKRTAI